MHRLTLACKLQGLIEELRERLNRVDQQQTQTAHREVIDVIHAMVRPSHYGIDIE